MTPPPTLHNNFERSLVVALMWLPGLLPRCHSALRRWRLRNTHRSVAPILAVGNNDLVRLQAVEHFDKSPFPATNADAATNGDTLANDPHLVHSGK
jgi:hypothetical protein